MASSRKKGGGDFVLESRHLVGLFLMLVVIFGIVFTLGYLLGRTQYDSKLRSAISKPVEDATPAPVRVAATKKDDVDAPQQEPLKNDPTWDFYHATDAKDPQERLQPATATPTVVVEARPAKAILPGPKSSASIDRGGASQKGLVNPKGDIMLQIAAVTTEKDALSLARALQQKKIFAFVVKPGVDKYYRVQEGPYADMKAAAAARHELESKGFKSIIKR